MIKKSLMVGVVVGSALNALVGAASAQTLGPTLPVSGGSLVAENCGSVEAAVPLALYNQVGGSPVTAPSNGRIVAARTEIGSIIDCGDDGGGNPLNTPLASAQFAVQVMRSNGAGGYTVVSRGANGDFAANAITTVGDQSIPVQAGDVLGFYMVSQQSKKEIVYTGLPLSEDAFLDGTPGPVGSTFTTAASIQQLTGGTSGGWIAHNFEFVPDSSPTPTPTPNPTPTPTPAATLELSGLSVSPNCALYGSGVSERVGFNINRKATARLRVEQVVGASTPSSRCPRRGQARRHGRSISNSKVVYSETSDLEAGARNFTFSLKKAKLYRKPGFYRAYIEASVDGYKVSKLAGNFRVASKPKQ